MVLASTRQGGLPNIHRMEYSCPCPIFQFIFGVSGLLKMSAGRVATCSSISRVRFRTYFDSHVDVLVLKQFHSNSETSEVESPVLGVNAGEYLRHSNDELI